MTVTSVPSGHFQGGRGVNSAPTTGDDLRSLETVLNQVIADTNAMEASVVTPIISAATFPTLAAVIAGQIYRVTVAAMDNNATRTNTGQSFIAGDEIIWNGTNWTLLGHGPSIVVPSAIGVAAAGTNADKSNSDHVHAHGNQLGGTLHADAVAGVSSGFFPAASATMLAAHDVSIAAIVDDHVLAVCAGINPKTDESEVSAALNGLVTKHFMPTHVAIEVTAAAAPLNGNATINIGTAADGAQIAAALSCTGLTTVGAVRLHPIPVNTFTILANATLFANVESAEGGAGTATYKVTIFGRQF